MWKPESARLGCARCHGIVLSDHSVALGQHALTRLFAQLHRVKLRVTSSTNVTATPLQGSDRQLVRRGKLNTKQPAQVRTPSYTTHRDTTHQRLAFEPKNR